MVHLDSVVVCSMGWPAVAYLVHMGPGGILGPVEGLKAGVRLIN